MQKLLHITSQYGKFEREGLDIFLLDINADDMFLETLRLTDDEMFLGKEEEFDMDAFFEEDNTDNIKEAKTVTCPKCGKVFEL